MTTIVVDLRVKRIGADTFVSTGYAADKIWTSKRGIFGCAGDDTIIARFEDWILRDAPKPDQLIGDCTEAFEALQVSDGMLFVWESAMRPNLCKRPYHAIGSGGKYAMGALRTGASIKEALRFAAEFDADTKPPFTFLDL